MIARPDGVSAAELINENALDRRKLSALKFWGLIEDTGTKLRLSERGLLVARDNGANRVVALREVVASVLFNQRVLGLDQDALELRLVEVFEGREHRQPPNELQY